MSYFLGLIVNEVPFLVFVLLAASTGLAFAQGDVKTPGAWATAGLAGLTAAGLFAVARRSLSAMQVVRRALDDGLGPGWRS